MLNIDNLSLQIVENYEYLGVKLDNMLTMDKAVAATSSRVSHKLYLLGLMRKYLTKKASINILKAMVLPYIDYPLFLYSSISDKSMTKLQRIQNRGC